MKENKIVLTRKIQLLIHSEDTAVKRQTRETFWRWQRMVHRAANFIYTHQFIQEQVKDLFYFTDEVRVRLADSSANCPAKFGSWDTLRSGGGT